jgi:hypothetical protein
MTFPYGKDLLYQEDFMKKKFLFGLIALLSVSFIFFGCGGGGSDPSPNRTPVPGVTLDEAVNPDGVTVFSEQDNDTGIYYVYVSGTVPATYAYVVDGTTEIASTNWDAGTWGISGTTPANGKYTTIKIAGILDGTRRCRRCNSRR